MSETTRTITKSEGCRNIEFLLQFTSDNITPDRLLSLELSDAESLCRILRTGTKDGHSTDVFTRLDVALAVDPLGEHLPCYINGEVKSNFSGEILEYSERQYDYLCLHVIPKSIKEVRRALETHTFTRKSGKLQEKILATYNDFYKVASIS